MSIYEAAAAMGSALGSITAPSTPTVRIVPPGHGDDRHATRPAECWINLEPVGQEFIDEGPSSFIVVYTVRFHGWTAANNRTLETMSQKLGTFGAAITDALWHSSLGGYANRHAIALKDITGMVYETAADGDTAYVVRGAVAIHRQQSGG